MLTRFEHRFSEPDLALGYDRLLRGGDPLGQCLFGHYTDIFFNLVVRGREEPSVLDVGCGPGHIGIDMAARLPRGRFHFLDRSSRMIETARENVRQRFPDGGGPEFDFTQADARELEDAVEGQRYDVVICRFLIQFLDDPETVLAAAYRALRPGGQLIFNLSGHNTFNYSAAGNSLLSHEFYARLIRASREILTRRLNALPDAAVSWLAEAGLVVAGPRGVILDESSLVPKYDLASTLRALSRAGVAARQVRHLIVSQRQTTGFRRRYSRVLGSVPVPGIWDVLEIFDPLTRQVLVEEIYDRAFEDTGDTAFMTHDPVFIVSREGAR
jgi:SAM-dependent methyltransferase